MRFTVSCISFSLAALAIVCAMAVLVTSPPEYCGAELCQPQTAALAPAAQRDAMPRRNPVIVRVEVNEPGFEVGWADGK